MKRARIVLALLALLAAAQLVTACGPFRGPGSDAKDGAAIGFAIGGPEGAAIASALWVAIGFVVRRAEKRTLRRKGLLTDRIARRPAPPAPTTHAPPAAHAPSGQYPQQTLPTDVEPFGH